MHRRALAVLLVAATALAQDPGKIVEEARARATPRLERLLGPIPADIPIEVLGDDAFRARYLERYGDEYAAVSEDARVRSRLWRCLAGLEAEIAVDGAGSVGFCDGKRGRIALRRRAVLPDPRMPPEYSELTATNLVAHELVHACRGRGGPDAASSAGNGTSDGQLALRALGEGDAQVLARAAAAGDYTEERLREDVSSWIRGAGDSEVYSGTIAENYSLAPYVEGKRFVARLLDDGGLPAVARAFRDPPASTEQILHPEKYLGRDRDVPVVIEIPDLADAFGADYAAQGAGDIGELELRLLFRPAFGGERAERIAEGWDGCGFRLYARETDEPALVLYSTWDTEADASAFALAVCELICRQHGDTFEIRTKVLGAGERRSADTPSGPVVAIRRAKDVVLVYGYEGDPRPVLIALWDRTRFK